MKKTLIAAAFSGIFSLPALTFAADAAPASPHTLTGNLTLTTDYRFRGISQTFKKPAIQGGIDYSHASGFYLGNWNSNVNSGAGFPDGNLEMDFYGGYKTSVGDVGLDIGGIFYYYPGSEASVLGLGAESGAVSNKEIYIGATWKFLSVKYYHSVDDYFSLRGVDSTGTATGQDTKGSNYLDIGASYDLGNGWGINGHVGHLNFKNVHNGNYTDWKLGVTKDVNGWVFAAAYIGTDAKGQCTGATSYQPYCFTNSNSNNGAGGINFGTKTKDAGDDTVVLSVTKAF
ncbi:MAG: TorF family putative porin [Rugosibacter sp.]|nr:TorF family putative porin [Rugosibacter sp.]